MAKAFQLDLNRCTGCQACLLACAIENEVPMNTGWRTVYTFNKQHHPALPVYHLTLACNHCDDPACLRGCPTRAYSIDRVTGAVVLDQDRCMGCTYCTWMCPYGAPRYDRDAGVVRKCTFCNDRLHNGLEPACVAYCPTTALRVGDRETVPRDDRVAGFTDYGIGPGISLIRLRDNARIPQFAPIPPVNMPVSASSGSHPGNGPRISWRSEWTLVVFTFFAPLLTAWLTAAAIGRLSLVPPVFVTLNLMALAVSTLHLGRKSKAHLAMTNWRQSWLSREVLAFFCFVATSSLWAIGSYIGPAPAFDILGWTAVAFGVGAMHCVDMVYVAAATVDRHRWHSASALLTATFYISMFVHLGWVVFLAGGVKAALYVARKRKRSKDGRGGEPSVSTARVGIGLVLPLVIWLTDFPGASVLAFSCILVGEFIDRCEFYNELEIVTPAWQIARDQRAEKRKASGKFLRGEQLARIA